jgi:hypothetical protein
MELFGQDLDVLVAVVANVVSWIVVRFCPSFLPYLLPKIDVAIDDDNRNEGRSSSSIPVGQKSRDSISNTQCIAIGRPGGNEQLRIVTLKEGYATRGYNVVLPSEHKRRQHQTNSSSSPADDSRLVASSPFVDITDESNLPSGTVVVKIHSFSVNYADCCIRWGLYESANKFVGWPIIPGFDISGIVEKVVGDTCGFQVGDRVYGATFFGAYSTRCLVPVQQVRKIPDGFSFAQAASIPGMYCHRLPVLMCIVYYLTVKSSYSLIISYDLSCFSPFLITVLLQLFRSRRCMHCILVASTRYQFHQRHLQLLRIRLLAKINPYSYIQLQVV